MPKNVIDHKQQTRLEQKVMKIDFNHIENSPSAVIFLRAAA